MGSVLESELGQKWTYGVLKGIHRLKLISSKKYSGFKRVKKSTHKIILYF